MALLRREKTGRGDYIDIAMHRRGARGLPNVDRAGDGGEPPARSRSTSAPPAARPSTRSTRRATAATSCSAAQEMKFVRNLLDRARPAGPRAALRCAGPGPHQQPVIEFLAGVFRSKPLAEALARLVRRPRRQLRPGQHAARGARGRERRARAAWCLSDELGRRHIAPVDPLPGRAGRGRALREPALGEHTDASLARAQQISRDDA